MESVVITVFTRSQHWPPRWAAWIQFTCPTLFKIRFDDDDDHIDGVRLRLWTAANRHIVHPQVIYEYEEPWWNDVDRGTLIRPILPPQSYGNKRGNGSWE
jgi:hypothetical protein